MLTVRLGKVLENVMHGNDAQIEYYEHQFMHVLCRNGLNICTELCCVTLSMLSTMIALGEFNLKRDRMGNRWIWNEKPRDDIRCDKIKVIEREENIIY